MADRRNLLDIYIFPHLLHHFKIMRSNQSMLKNHISTYISSVLYAKHQILQAQQSSLQIFGR